jgi:hypothetical protein
MAMALSAEDRLRTRFGREWFVSEVCLRKFRDYWRAGYRLSLKEILIDLDVSAKFEYFWSFDS